MPNAARRAPSGSSAYRSHPEREGSREGARKGHKGGIIHARARIHAARYETPGGRSRSCTRVRLIRSNLRVRLSSNKPEHALAQTSRHTRRHT